MSKDCETNSNIPSLIAGWSALATIENMSKSSAARATNVMNLGAP